MNRFINVDCAKCHKLFLRPNGRFNEAVKFGWNQFCSNECQYQYRVTRRMLNCETCGSKIERELSAISMHNYCSSRCAMIMNNKKYPRKRPKPELKKCASCKKFYRKSSGNRKYCSRKCRNENERYKPEELLKIIAATTRKFGRVPGKRGFSWDIISASIKEFGSWNKAVAHSGFTPNRSHDDRMYRRIISRAKDGHYCDSVSEILIDNWLHEHKIPHEKDVVYPTTNHRADWRVSCDNKLIFVEYFGLANDSPRYDRAMKKKEKLCKEQNIELIKILPKDLYPQVSLHHNLRRKFQII